MPPEDKRKTADNELAELTARDPDEFSAERYEIPAPEDLETVEADEE
jgi:hypothetical protein